MFRALYILIIALVVVFVTLQVRHLSKSEPLPVFLRHDAIAKAHQTQIELQLHSMFEPTTVQQQKLVQDYRYLWAHLNHLYASNDLETGKEYYTEDWFRFICKELNPNDASLLQRSDLQHTLHLMNWSSDGLVCTLIDSNVVFQYTYPDGNIRTEQAHLAIALLFQGDNWRIDAMRILHQEPIDYQP